MYRIIAAATLLASSVTLAVPASAQIAKSRSDQPIVLSDAQFKCLMKHRDDIAVSKRGNMFDITDCPPQVVNAAFPLPPSRFAIILTPAHVQCLKQVKPGDTRIVERRESGQVALYLRPCGRP